MVLKPDTFPPETQEIMQGIADGVDDKVTELLVNHPENHIFAKPYIREMLLDGIIGKLMEKKTMPSIQIVRPDEMHRRMQFSVNMRSDDYYDC